MVVAKSNRRKRQDRVKAGAKRAEQARRRAKAEREQQTAERYRACSIRGPALLMWLESLRRSCRTRLPLAR